MGKAQNFSNKRGGHVRQPAIDSAFSIPANELLDAAIRFVVGHLHRGMFGKIGGRRMQYPADAAVERKLAAANRVDSHAG